MLEIIPGILEKEWSEIERKINLVRSFAKTIHIDIIDGKFAENSTFLDPQPFAKYSKEIFFEVHLMVEEPINYLKPFADVGFKRFLGQVEKMTDQEEFVARGELLGEVGLAVDGGTGLDKIKVSLGDLDNLLIMTVNAGYSGQKFNPEYLKKAEMLKQVQHDKLLPIEVDGGVNDATIFLAREAGATRFVANSFLFVGNNPAMQYQILEEKLKGGEKNG